MHPQLLRSSRAILLKTISLPSNERCNQMTTRSSCCMMLEGSHWQMSQPHLSPLKLIAAMSSVNWVTVAFMRSCEWRHSMKGWPWHDWDRLSAQRRYATVLRSSYQRKYRSTQYRTVSSQKIGMNSVNSSSRLSHFNASWRGVKLHWSIATMTLCGKRLVLLSDDSRSLKSLGVSHLADTFL